MLKSITMALGAVSLLALGACGEQVRTDSADAASEAAATDDRATDRDDGLMENAGEAIDGAGEHVEESINNATDDNPNTNP